MKLNKQRVAKLGKALGAGAGIGRVVGKAIKSVTKPKSGMRIRKIYPIAKKKK